MKPDDDLKRMMARMLPERLYYLEASGLVIREKEEPAFGHHAKETELLSLVREIELGLGKIDFMRYAELLAHAVRDQETVQPFYEIVFLTASASWQQRVTALAIVKGIA